MSETQDSQDKHLSELRRHLIFVPAVTRTFSRSFGAKIWTVRRRQVPLTSALNRTVQSSQSLTFRNGVVGDLGNMNTDRDNYWLNIYVLLSRATRLQDILLFRCPPKDFFDAAPPPKYLRDFLRMLNVQGGPIHSAREEADRLLSEFGWPLP